ncbi:MAG: T9SS type A sorting domain-containing protein [Chitinophagales bacterium]|nr:right-handed parallel beta-helix repeat-containing protein [Bacteroidota bacterium]MCB9044219.1 right-handed parallel beta-helix repeat-containing protein [Chitinophagales bacterium]
MKKLIFNVHKLWLCAVCLCLLVGGQTNLKAQLSCNLIANTKPNSSTINNNIGGDINANLSSLGSNIYNADVVDNWYPVTGNPGYFTAFYNLATTNWLNVNSAIDWELINKPVFYLMCNSDAGPFSFYGCTGMESVGTDVNITKDNFYTFSFNKRSYPWQGDNLQYYSPAYCQTYTSLVVRLTKKAYIFNGIIANGQTPGEYVNFFTPLDDNDNESYQDVYVELNDETGPSFNQIIQCFQATDDWDVLYIYTQRKINNENDCALKDGPISPTDVPGQLMGNALVADIFLYDDAFGEDSDAEYICDQSEVRLEIPAYCSDFNVVNYTWEKYDPNTSTYQALPQYNNQRLIFVAAEDGATYRVHRVFNVLDYPLTVNDCNDYKLFHLVKSSDCAEGVNFLITEDAVINNPITWKQDFGIPANTTITINADFTIPDNVSLNLSGEVLAFGPCGRLIVAPGGTLDADGTIFQSAGNCMWHGIQVRGEGLGTSYNTAAKYGMLDLRNCTISDAIVGVSMSGFPRINYAFANSAIQSSNFQYNAYSDAYTTNTVSNLVYLNSGGTGSVSGGGRATIFETDFVDCLQGVNASYYASDIEKVNISDCHFEGATNLKYPFANQPSEVGVHTQYYRGITVEDQSTFNNLRFGVRGQGVGNMYVRDSYFTNITAAGTSIKGALSAENVKIDDNEYTTCQNAIQCSGGITVEFNTINKGAGSYTAQIQVGIFAHAANGFVYNNYLNDVAAGMVALHNSYNLSVSRNYFGYNKYGLATMGNNKGIHTKCNTFYNSAASWGIYNANSNTNDAFLSTQGVCDYSDQNNPMIDLPLNRFYEDPAYRDINPVNLLSSFDFDYYYPDDLTNPNFTLAGQLQDYQPDMTSYNASYYPEIDILSCQVYSEGLDYQGNGECFLYYLPIDIEDIPDEPVRDRFGHLWVEHYFSQNQGQAAFQLLQAMNTRSSKLFLLDNAIAHNNLTTANSIYNALKPVLDKNTAYIKSFQLALLKKPNLTMSAAQESQLLSIALQNSAAAPWARAYLSALKGYAFAEPAVDLILNQATAKQASQLSAKPALPKHLQLSPNPAQAQVQLYIQAMPPTATDLQVRISDWQGNIYQSLPVAAGQQTLSLSLKAMPPGVYVVQLYQHQNLIAYEKLLVLP